MSDEVRSELERLRASILGFHSKIEIAEKEIGKCRGYVDGADEIITDLRTRLAEEKARNLVSLEVYSKLTTDLQQEQARRVELRAIEAKKRHELRDLRQKKDGIQARYDELSKTLTSAGACVLPFRQEKT